jgi:hypothetical protein
VTPGNDASMEDKMTKKVALLTPSHRGDLARFTLLCASVDGHAHGYAHHYVIVNDDDPPAFAPFASNRRILLPASRFLPSWLRLPPPALTRNTRRVWWSFRSSPVHGWHIQQLLKIGGVLDLLEERFCIVDSDNVLFRLFAAAAYASGDRTPLVFGPQAIREVSPLHGVWTRNCDMLLGFREATAFPADDYIGDVIAWAKQTLIAMTGRIETATRRSWRHELSRTPAFSEYLLYGNFARRSAQQLATHEKVAQSLACAYWTPLPRARSRSVSRPSPTRRWR